MFCVLFVKARVNVLRHVLLNFRNWRGTTDKDYGRQLIVSLTSFPARIKTVHITIASLMMQTMKPNKIILWLAEEEFPGKDKDLPDSLMRLKEHGLEINYCDNIRSYKKLIPSLKLYPEAMIVTADDDLYYRSCWLHDLYSEHRKHPEDLCAHRITKFYLHNGDFETKGGGYDIYPCRASYLHKLTGVGGVIYPPHVLYNDVTNSELFMNLCTTNDDIWFWLMAVLNHVKIRVTEHNRPHLLLVYVGKTQKGPTLSGINDRGEKLFWKDFYRVLKHYPELEGILREEYMRVK